MKKHSDNEPNLSKITQEFLDDLQKRGGKPIYELPPEEARLFLINLQCETHKEIKADVYDKAVFTGENGTVNLRIVRPKNSKEKLPVIFYIHGGGWVMGNSETHDMLIRKIAVSSNSMVIFPEYDLSPEAKFPTAINQCYAALKYVCENHEEFNANPEKVVVAGDSAGGNMATVLTMMAKEKGVPKIIYQILLYPVTDADMDTESYKEFKDGPYLTKKSMEWFWNAYLDDRTQKDDIYVSPLKAPLENLQNLPPALVITDENDVLRDEGEMYAKKLQEAGVDVLSVRINGTIHDFAMLNAMFESSQTKCAFTLICSVLKEVLLK